jgi:hypothetical protein
MVTLEHHGKDRPAVTDGIEAALSDLLKLPDGGIVGEDAGE